MYDHVLVPTDGSERMHEALEHAASLVQQYNATLHAVHVVQQTGATDALDDGEFETAVERIERAGQEAAETIAEQARSNGVDNVETAVITGIPAEAILEYTDQHDIDVVVMATSGRTGDAREIVGSVTEAVIRSSPVPVFTVNTDCSSSA
ncbi:universal stress protein [Halovenus rubra]|uniref:Universal stress protein n=2 Tax=Halovenus rubra TaxID=869890 RepID=A0ACC7DZV8_9EURY|nr:universal stress protein [Halovenus rubra]